MRTRDEREIETYRILFAYYIGYHHVVRGWTDIFIFSLSKYVNADQVNFGVTVLARLGRGHFDYFAWSLLDQDEAVFAQRRALHWK